MNLLFVCNQGKHRSRTAEFIFRGQFNTRSRGLYSEHPLQKEDLEWADLVFVMEDFQRKAISEWFPAEYLRKQIISLGIPDSFSFNDPALIGLLKERINDIIPAIH